MTKGSKIQSLHWAILCALVCGKNIKTGNTTSLKSLHKMAYLEWTCVDFKAYAHGNGHIYGKLHDNMPKFGTTVGIIIVHNVSIGITINPF